MLSQQNLLLLQLHLAFLQTCSYNRVFQKAKQAKIHFSNGATVTIQISPHKLSQQLWKAGYVLSQMNMQDSSPY